jgi:hypothetical protein
VVTPLALPVVTEGAPASTRTATCGAPLGAGLASARSACGRDSRMTSPRAGATPTAANSATTHPTSTAGARRAARGQRIAACETVSSTLDPLRDRVKGRRARSRPKRHRKPHQRPARYAFVVADTADGPAALPPMPQIQPPRAPPPIARPRRRPAARHNREQTARLASAVRPAAASRRRVTVASRSAWEARTSIRRHSTERDEPARWRSARGLLPRARDPTGSRLGPLRQPERSRAGHRLTQERQRRRR